MRTIGACLVGAFVVSGCDRLEACYAGDGAGRTCLELVLAEEISDPSGDYDYPTPLGGSRQYREPVAYLDLDVVAGGTRLAPNFRLDELAQSSKGSYAVVQPHAVDALQDIRDELGPVRVTSGFRSPGYNASVTGSATYSRHMYGDAFDLQGIDATLKELRAECEFAGASFTLMYASHVHCDWRDDDMDEAFYGPPEGAAVAPAVATELRVLASDPLDAWIERRADGHLEAPAMGWPEGEPHRAWTAFDAAGAVLGTGRGEVFVPPGGAVYVDVIVGGDLQRGIDL